MYRAVIIYVIFYASINFFVCYPTDCSDEEIEHFLKSDELNSLFTHFAITSRRPISLNYTANKNAMKYAFNSSNTPLLPSNQNSYFQQHPPYLCDQPARAIFHVTVLSLDTVNESEMTFHLNIWLTIAWIDDRLNYPESNRDYQLLDPKWLNVIWRPVVVFKNAQRIKSYSTSAPNHSLMLLRNKAVVYSEKYGLLLSCLMDFQTYPHDLQTCYLKMESTIHTEMELLFQWDQKNNVSFHLKGKNIDTPQFSIPKVTVLKFSEPYLAGNYSSLQIAFYLQRRLGYHLIHSYIPSACIVLLSWISFWMSSDAVAPRFALGLTTLLTLATLNTQSQATLPPVSYAKAIDEWMLCCACLVFFSLIESAVVNYVHGGISAELNANHANSVTKSQTERSRWPECRHDCAISNAAHNIDLISRVFFPLCFITLNIWYWTKYLRIHDGELPN